MPCQVDALATTTALASGGAAVVMAPPAAAVRRGGGSSAASRAMARHAAGEAGAFEVLYDELAPRLYGFLRRRLREGALAEDALHQTFLYIHESRSRFAAGAEVEPWAYAIARRVAIDAFRRRRREQPRGVGEALGEGEGPNPFPDGEEVARASELERRLREELERLPPLQREALLLVRYEGLSLAQAAQVLGIQEGALRVRLHRASGRLRLALGLDAVEGEAGE
ncbi:MAG: RNA polymerase sigma factor [Polyangiaceae bacterium]|jgi:RNA polymerase sigma-70 factor (ECF subfamily)|nr:RNA polymerase sigma factor [Polyangiaceae bacterium]